MPYEAERILIAHSMGWTLHYVDSLEVKERAEVMTVLSAWNKAQKDKLTNQLEDA
jgi:hypothetical protein